jgi:hypothetical protein
MSTVPHEIRLAAGLTPLSVEDDGRGLTKVYWPTSKKDAFSQEAKSHGRRESEYARFILEAREDPLLFLQLCRLLHPGFGAGLMGNTADAGRVADLEKQLLEARHEADTLLKERAGLEKQAEELERRLAGATDRAQELAAHVVDLARLQEANRERAVQGGAEYEATAGPFLPLVKLLRVAGRMTRKELEAALVTEAGLGQASAQQAVNGAGRLGLIVKGADARFRLAKAPAEDEE